MTGSDDVHRRTVLAATLALGALGARPGVAQRGQIVGVSMPTKSSARWIDDGNNLVRTKINDFFQVRLIGPLIWIVW